MLNFKNKKVHLLSKFLAIYLHVTLIMLLTAVTTEYTQVHWIHLAQEMGHLWVLSTSGSNIAGKKILE
jgi:hypothetical protein